ncbi:MAG TPA: hypothetical protein PLJ35_04360 [Anaerolineae bacterium]|nr:hypothetical protein [Anaerolineae bacterium]HOQ98036.1 hypothetical protein [Anaerolineae bacterium]HPL29086.1 hypothetical protein [Anaerolineae bacterium]
MEGRTITVLDPVSRPKSARTSLNPRPKDLVGLRVGLLDNTKPNFTLFLDRVEELLMSEYKVASVIRYTKPGRTEPLSPQVIAQIKGQCDIVITGLGD